MTTPDICTTGHHCPGTAQDTERILNQQCFEFELFEETYKRQPAEQYRQPTDEICTAFLMVSIEDTGIRIYISAACDPVAFATELSEIWGTKKPSYAMEMFDKRSWWNSYHFETDTRQVVMEIPIPNTGRRVSFLWRDYFVALKCSCHSRVPCSKPLIALRPMMDQLKFLNVEFRKQDTIVWRRVETFSKVDLNEFLQSLQQHQATSTGMRAIPIRKLSYCFIG